MYKHTKGLILLVLMSTGVLLGACGGTQTTAIPAEPQPIEAVVDEVTEESAPAQIPEPSPTFTVEPPPTAAPDVILWEDDFADVNSGWERYRRFDGILDYENDIYRMYVDGPDNFFWVSYDWDSNDMIIEAEFTQVDGPDNNLFGLMCRYDSANLTAYVFVINSQGEYSLGTMENLQFTPLAGGEMTYSEVIKPIHEMNVIRAACVGGTLGMWVNGQLLIELSDHFFEGDDFGLVAATYEGAGTDIHIDNLRVIATE